MSKATYKPFVKYCKDFAIEHLQDMKGWNESAYGADLGYKLTESINVDGSATYSTYEAREYIKHWWDEAAEVYKYQKSNYGEVLQNPFENPEAFHVCMIIEGVNALLAKCETVENGWNDKIDLTARTINKIIKEIKAIDTIDF